MARKIILCMDGTGNEVGAHETNILRLYKGLQKRTDTQVVHYLPGIGTLDGPSVTGRIKQRINSVLGMACGYGLEDDVLDGYRFICENFDHDRPADDADQIMIFGFSRGAYASRLLAAFIYNFGLLPPHQLHMAPQVFRAYRAISDDKNPDRYNLGEVGKKKHDDLLYQKLREYGRALEEVAVPIRFLGLYDTVSSMVRLRRPLTNLRRYRSLMELGTHANVDINPSVKMVRHVLAIDERRSMFRGQFWEKTNYRPTRFQKDIGEEQDVRQVWFAGCHGDMVGSSREDESGIAKITFLWMLDELHEKGLELEFKKNYLSNYILGEDEDRKTPSGQSISKPNALDKLHGSLKGPWLISEIFPKSFRRRETRKIPWLLFYYLPFGERRKIPEDHDIHESVFERREKTGYNPSNLEAHSPKP